MNTAFLKKHTPTLLLIAVLLVFYLIIYLKTKPEATETPFQSDLYQIKSKGTLRVITEYNAIGYFIFKNQKLGLDYELMRHFASSLNINIEFVIAQNHQELYDLLKEGEGDIIASGLLEDEQQQVSYTLPYRNIEQVVVQRKATTKNLKKDSTNAIHQTIQHLSALQDKTIFLTANSPYYIPLKKMADTLGLSLNISTITDQRGIEDLIEAVSNGEINFTIANKDIAQIYDASLNNIDYSLALTELQALRYAVRTTSPDLLVAFNDWLKNFKKTKTFSNLMAKYFVKGRAILANFNEQDYLTQGQISSYDNIIQYYAKLIDWDWRLVAAIIYQESKFNPYATSWAGAKGLMQLMPRTAQQMGLTGNPYHYENNIKAGTNYLRYLEQFWKHIPDYTQRKKFILASYNAGAGHVQDAARLAKKYGYNEQEWDGNVEYFILYKSNPKFYSDKVVKYGYCRGTEPFNYVRNIVKKYFYYSDNIIDTSATRYSIQYKEQLPFSGIDGVYNPSEGLQLRNTKQELFVSHKLFEENKELLPKHQQEDPFNKPSKELFQKEGNKKLFQQKNELFKKDSSSGQLIAKPQQQFNQLQPKQ